MAALLTLVALAVPAPASANVSPTRMCDRACRRRVAKRFRPALASWYGPSLWGNPLGCGGTLWADTRGVAHKTMRCGQRLRICARRCATTRVIDRGPYVGAREFDLTQAFAGRVGFSGVGRVYVHRVGR